MWSSHPFCCKQLSRSRRIESQHCAPEEAALEDQSPPCCTNNHLQRLFASLPRRLACPFGAAIPGKRQGPVDLRRRYPVAGKAKYQPWRKSKWRWDILYMMWLTASQNRSWGFLERWLTGCEIPVEYEDYIYGKSVCRLERRSRTHTDTCFLLLPD